jgi:hypothetical protein
VYISSLTLFPYKPDFLGKFYLRFVPFGIKASHYVEYELECSSSSIRSNELRPVIKSQRGRPIGWIKNILVLYMVIVLGH